jgi:hypothetical protein
LDLKNHVGVGVDADVDVVGKHRDGSFPSFLNSSVDAFAFGVNYDLTW